MISASMLSIAFWFYAQREKRKWIVQGGGNVDLLVTCCIRFRVWRWISFWSDGSQPVLVNADMWEKPTVALSAECTAQSLVEG